MAFDLPKGAPGKVWGIILSALTVVAGAVLVIYPADSIPSLVLASGVCLRSQVNRLYPQV